MAPVPAAPRKRGRPPIDLAPYDPADYLAGPEDEAALLHAAFAEEDRDTDGQLVVRALNAIARKHGMTDVAARAGLNPTGLYKTLSPGRQPSIATILRVLNALGYRLTPQPIGQDDPS